MAGDLPGRIDDFIHRKPVSRSHVESVALSSAGEVLQCPDVGLRQIDYMNVVTNACSIGCLVIVAEDPDLLAPVECHLQNERDEVGLWIVILSQFTIWIGAGGIEIPENHTSKGMGTIESAKHFFHSQFCIAIHIDRILRMIFPEWEMNRFPIGCAGRREDELPDSALYGCLKKIERIGCVVSVVLERIVHRFAHIAVRRKMNHCFHRLFFQQRGESIAVGQGELVKCAPCNRLSVPLGEIIHNDRVKPLPK